MSKNLEAFLDTIAYAEGTYGRGDNGYNVLVGGTLFDSYADHPGKRIWIGRWNIWSTAAGRYQILKRYYAAYKKILKLPDFSPASQDAIAIRMIKEQGALMDIERGKIRDAIRKCRNIWASFPGAGYGQREHSMDELLRFYVSAGGTIHESA